MSKMIAGLPAKEYHRRWREKNPESVRRSLRKHEASGKRKATRYGLTVAQLGALPKECQLCSATEHLHIDHDHESNVVRGVLCINCNTSLGTLGDNVAGLERVIQYLNGAAQRPQTTD